MLFGATAKTLDPLGRAQASLTLPLGLPAGLGGSALRHAVVTFDPLAGIVTRTSNAVPLRITP